MPTSAAARSGWRVDQNQSSAAASLTSLILGLLALGYHFAMKLMTKVPFNPASGGPAFLCERDKRFVLFDLAIGQVSWRGVALLAALFIGSLGVAAVLTPVVYWAAEWWDSASSKFATQQG